jgi:hypothetical protein
MADYYPLLNKAVQGLDPSSAEARQGIYERARSALTRQLASLDPPVAQAVLDRELGALEEVIRRIESESRASLPDVATVRDSEVARTERVAPPVPASSSAVRPQAPRRSGTRKRNPLIGLAVAAGVVVVAAIGTLAFLKRNDPPVTAGRSDPPSSSPASPVVSTPKTSERVTSGRADTPASSVPTTPAPLTTAPVSPAPAQPAVQPAIAIANRMALVLEAVDKSQNVVVRQGTVVWRTEMVSGGQGQALQQAIKAIVDVPEARLRAEITIQRNLDTAFPASHTIQTQFSSLPGSEVGPIQSLSLMELRQSENQQGYAVAGQGIAVMENVFLVALTQVEPAASRNVDMLKSRPLLYVEFVATNGRRGGMVIEKGVSGQQAFDEAFRSWQ